MEDGNKFLELLKLNVNDKTEKKKTGNTQLTYLSWSFAWSEFVKVYPNAKYEIVKNEDGLPYFHDESGAMVYTKVTAGGLTHEMWLPVMDGANNAMKTHPYTYQVKEYNYGKATGKMIDKTVNAYTMFDINKTVMRCLVKNLAMFGLGLYIYAGEDLPESDEPTPQPQQPKEPDRINAQQLNEIRKLIEETESDTEAFCKWLKVGSLTEIYAGHYSIAINQLNKKLAEKVMG